MTTNQTVAEESSVDVSSVKELARRWYPDSLTTAPDKGASHRALDDVRESVAELRHYRDTVFRPATNLRSSKRQTASMRPMIGTRNS